LYCIVIVSLTKHVTHNINIMHNILKGHNKLDYYEIHQIH